VALWARPEELRDTLPAEIATTPNSKKLDYLMRAVTPDTWNGRNVKPSRFHIETPLKSILGTIADDPPVLSFQLPDPPFFPEIEFHHQNAVVRLSNISHYAPDGEDTFETPCVAELNPFYGAKLYYSSRAVRVEPEGIGIITSLTTSNLHIHSLLKHHLIFEIFKLCGMTLELSQPGRIASRLIHQMGGIQGCRVFKIPGVRDLIESVGPQEVFTRTNAICRIHNNGMFITNAKIDPINAAIEPCETDFVFLHSPTKWWDRRVAVAVGECKTRGGISEDDVRKLGRVADALDERGFKAFVLFAKLAPFTLEDVEICRKAQNRGKNRVIILSDRELECYRK